MNTRASSLVVLSSFALIAAGCADEQSDDISSTSDAVLTCGGFHHGEPGKHIGHHHGRHHHHHNGGGGSGMMGGSTGTGGQPHLTGTGGSGMTGGSTGTGGSGMTGGTMGTGGSGGAMVDPRCADVSGIVSWWHADGDFDDAVGSNDGTNGGAESFVAGEKNQAFGLNGSFGSDVVVPHDPSLMMSGAFTLDAWVNVTQFGGRIIDKATAFGADGYLMDLPGNALRLWMSTDSITSSTPVPAGIWTHVAAVYDGANLGLYINGVLDVEAPTPITSVAPNLNPLHIGADSDGGSVFNGSIDEPRVFNRALTADEIARLFWQAANCQ